jgi:hypothetical protein
MWRRTVRCRVPRPLLQGVLPLLCHNFLPGISTRTLRFRHPPQSGGHRICTVAGITGVSIAHRTGQQPNSSVAVALDVDRFWEMMIDAIVTL